MRKKISFELEVKDDTEFNNLIDFICSKVENLTIETTEDDKKKKISGIKSKIIEMMDNAPNIYKKSDDGTYHKDIYVDYSEQYLSKETLAEIFKSDCSCPRDVFYEILNEWAENNYGYEWKDFKNNLKDYLTDEEYEIFEEYEDEFGLSEMLEFSYNPEDFSKTMVDLNIEVDTGDANYEFTCNNVLNYCKSGIQDTSSILWLCEQQGRKKEYLKAVELYEKENDNIDTLIKNHFVKSVCYELENLTSQIGVLVFMIKVSLEDAFKLTDAYISEMDLNNSYYIEKRKGKGVITLGKETNCGLYDPWNGGGSILEIELEKDVELPIKYIHRITPNAYSARGDYSISCIYGIDSRFWKEELKNIA